MNFFKFWRELDYTKKMNICKTYAYLTSVLDSSAKIKANLNKLLATTKIG
jgi:hypothetical protein